MSELGGSSTEKKENIREDHEFLDGEDLETETNHGMRANTERRRLFFRSFEAKSLKSRSLLTQVSDDLTSIFSSPMILVFHAALFFFWITSNIGWYDFITPFDPYPFGFLTLVVSLEAIFLSIFILVS